MLSNREVILAKIEATYGTDSVPSPADDAVLVESPNWSMSGMRMVDRPMVTASIDTKQAVYAGALKQVTFDVELKGTGSAYSATNYPEVSAILRSCRFAENIVVTGGSESVTYLPSSASLESCTIYYYQDGTRHVLTGCRGNMSLNLEAGGIGKMSFTMTGHFSAMTDAALPSPSYLVTVPPPIIGGGFSVDGYGAVIAALSLDMSNTIATPPDFNAADGYAAVQITKRDPNGSFDPEATTVSVASFEADLLSGKQMALTTGVIGVNQYNRFSVVMPTIAYRDMSPGDRDGVRIYEMPFGAGIGTGDDEVSISFT